MRSVALGTRVEHLVDSRSVGFGCWLYRRTRGRATRLWRRRALILTTVGRRSGLPRTVLVQCFPDGEDFIVVAANSGLPAHPGWYFNLTARPQARVEVEGRVLGMRAVELDAAEAARWWPRVLATAPDYARYRQCTARTIPLLRLTPDTANPVPPVGAAGRRSTEAFAPGMSLLRLGEGPPLLFLPGLTSHHGVPFGMERRAAVGSIRPLAATRQVWWVNRRAGLTSPVTMADLAADYAAAIPRWFTGPVDVVGVSTGGSVALQLAADHPGLVRRLVLVSAASRLAVSGRHSQRRLCEVLTAGEYRSAGAVMLRGMGTETTASVWAGLGWLLGPVLFRRDPADLLATLAAEDTFDLTDRLPQITVPVLLIGGDRDIPYGPARFARTAAGLPNGRLLLYRHTSHAGVQARPRFTRDVLAFLDGHRTPPVRRPGRTPR